MFLLAACVLGAGGCGKGSKAPDKGQAAGSAVVDEGTPAPSKAPAPTARKLPNLPLQADAADTWKLEADPVAPEGGARLSTSTAEVSVMKDGVGGVKKMTLDDEKAQMPKDPAPPQDVEEEQLADGWSLSFKTAGILPYHATVYRNIGTGSYRCVVTSEQAAELADGIAVCKSLRP